MIKCLECDESYLSINKKCPNCGTPTPYVCNKCNKALEDITSVCQCNGFAIRNPEESQMDKMVSNNFKKLESYILGRNIVLGLFAITLGVTVVVSRYISIPQISFLFILLIVLIFAYVCLHLIYYRCPYCDSRLRGNYKHHTCPSCGKKVI